MGIAGGGPDAGMAEQHLHDADVDPVLQQPGGIAVAEHMRCRPRLSILAGPSDGVGKALRQHSDMDRPRAPAIGKHPAMIAVVAPKTTQVFQDGRWDRHQAFFVPLADDSKPLVGAIDCPDLEIGGFADPKATGIDQLKAAAVNGVVDLSQNAPDNGIRPCRRQALLLRKADLFLVNSGQSRSKVWQ